MMLYQAPDLSEFIEDLDRLARFNKTSDSPRSVADEIQAGVSNHVSVNASKIKRQAAEDEARRQADVADAARAHDVAITYDPSANHENARAARERLSNDGR